MQFLPNAVCETEKSVGGGVADLSPLKFGDGSEKMGKWVIGLRGRDEVADEPRSLPAKDLRATGSGVVAKCEGVLDDDACAVVVGGVNIAARVTDACAVLKIEIDSALTRPDFVHDLLWAKFLDFLLNGLCEGERRGLWGD